MEYKIICKTILYLFISIIQFILTPLILESYKSLIFLIYMITMYMVIVLSIILYYKYREFKLKEIVNKYVIKSGICNSLMIVAGVYSSKPTRTPIFMQGIISSMTVILSILFTKYILKQEMYYNRRYLVGSLIFLFIAASIPITSMVINIELTNIYWTIVFIFSVILRTLYNIYLSGYISANDDNSNKLQYKIMGVLYSNLYRLPILLLFSPLEIVLSTTKKSMIENIRDSLISTYTEWDVIILFHIYTGFGILLFVLTMEMNSISANYNMIVSTIVGPIGSLYYVINSSANVGKHFSIEIVLPTLIANGIAIIMWINAEQKITELP